MTTWLPDDGEFGQRALLRAFLENVGEEDMADVEEFVAFERPCAGIWWVARDMERTTFYCALFGVDKF